MDGGYIAKVATVYVPTTPL